MQTEILVQEVP